jgi:hypothetical protein
MELSYQQARIIRARGLKDLITQNIVSGQGFGSSVGSAVSDKFKAKAKGISEKFDTLNVARMLGGKLGAAIIGRLTGRNQRDIEYFTGKRSGAMSSVGYSQNKLTSDYSQALYTNISEGQQQRMRKGDSVADILAKMYNFMKKSHEEQVKAMELAKDFDKTKKVTQPTAQKIQKEKMGLPAATKMDTDWLSSLLKKVGGILTTLSLVYSVLKDLLSPFLEFFRNLRFPGSPTPNRGNPSSSGKPTGKPPGKPDGKPPGKPDGKPTGQTPPEEKPPQKPTGQTPAEEGKPPGKTPTSSKIPEKLGFQKDALDKIRERAVRIAEDTAKRKIMAKYSTKIVAKGTLSALSSPLTLAMLAYDIADALAPTEQEALNTNFDSLMSIKDDMEKIQRDFDSGKIKNPKQYESSMKALGEKAKVIESRIKVLKDKAEVETYKMEAQLNEESAEAGQLTMIEKIKGLGSGLVKQVKQLGKDTAVSLHSNPSITDRLTTIIENDPAVKFFQANNENQNLNLQGNSSTVIVNKPTTNTFAGNGNSGGVTVDSSVNIRSEDSTLQKTSKQNSRAW